MLLWLTKIILMSSTTSNGPHHGFNRCYSGLPRWSWVAQPLLPQCYYLLLWHTKMIRSRMTSTIVLPNKCCSGFTALHRSLSKYLTATDTRGSPTLTKHNRTLARLGNLLYLQPRSTIEVNRVFLSLVLSKFIKKLYSSEVVNKFFSLYFPKTKLNNPVV